MSNSYLIYNEELRKENETAVSQLTYTPAFFLDKARREMKPLEFNTFVVKKDTIDINDIYIEDVDIDGKRDVPQVYLKSRKFTYYSKIKASNIKKHVFDPNKDTQFATSNVLRKFAIEYDKLLVNGETGDKANVGFISNPKTQNNPSQNIGSSVGDLSGEGLYTLILDSLNEAESKTKSIGEPKTVMLSSKIKNFLSRIYGSTGTYFERLLANVDSNVQFRKYNEDILGLDPGFFVIVDPLITYYMGATPQLYNQGENQEKGYSWYKYLMQSVGVDVALDGAVIHQPLTLA